MGMPLSIASLAIGFVAGVVGMGFAWNLMQRTVRNPEQTRLTSVWSLEDTTSPGEVSRLVTQRIERVPIPTGSRLVVPESARGKLPTDVVSRCDVRTHPDVHANYCVGRDRALVFASHIFPRAEAIWTMEPGVVQHLQDEFSRLWKEGEEYHVPCSIAEVPGHEGRRVAVQGLASDPSQHHGKRAFKLSQAGATVVVLTEDATAAVSGVTRVVGKIRREGNTLVIEASAIEHVDRAPAPRSPLPIPQA